MKRYLNLLITGILSVAALSSCDFYALDNVWDPELENVFYCGYDEWIAQRTDGTNQLKYKISQNETATMPFRLWSEFTRDFDVNVPIYFYSDENLVLNEDFKVTDASGNTLVPQSDGGYVLTWKNAVKGNIDVCVVALSSKAGKIKVQTCTKEQAATLTSQNPLSCIIVDNSDYQVRCFTENYYCTVILNQ